MGDRLAELRRFLPESREETHARLSAMAGVDPSGGIIPETGGDINREPNGWTTREYFDKNLPAETPLVIVTNIKPYEPSEPKKSIAARILEMLESEPRRAWDTHDLDKALGNVKLATLRSTMAQMRASGRAVQAGFGKIAARDTKLPEQPHRCNPRRITLPPAVEEACRVEAEPASPKTPPQKHAYLRNLVARAAVAVEIDLVAARDADQRIERLKRWGEHLFNMGIRAERGEDIPPDKENWGSAPQLAT